MNKNMKSKVKSYALGSLLVGGIATGTGIAVSQAKKDKKEVVDKKDKQKEIQDANVALFEATRSKMKFALAIVENEYPLYWDGRAWTVGAGLTILYDAKGKSEPVTSKTKALSISESDVYKGRYLTFEVLPDVKNLVKVPLTEDELVAVCVLRYCVGHGAFKDSNFLKYLNAGKKGHELAKTLTGFRKQEGVLRRCYFFAAILEGKLQYSDLLDLRAEGCYNIDNIGDVVVCSHGVKKVDKDGFCEWNFAKLEQNLQIAKKPRATWLHIDKKKRGGKVIKVNCKLAKEIVPNYVYKEASAGRPKKEEKKTLDISLHLLHDDAMKKYKSGDAEGSLTILEELSGTSFNSADLQNDISLIQYGVGNYKKALSAAKQALKLATTNTQRSAAFYNMGIVYMKQGRYKDAIKAFDDANALNKTQAAQKAKAQAEKLLQENGDKSGRKKWWFIAGAAALAAGYAGKKKYEQVKNNSR